MSDETAVVAQSDATEQVVTTNHAEESESAEAPKSGEPDPQANANEGEQEHEEKKKRLGGWQRKELRAKQEAEYWRKVALGELPSPVQKQEEAAKPDADFKFDQPKPKRPRPEDFRIGDTETYDKEAFDKADEEYAEKLADWKYEEREARKAFSQKREQVKTEEQKKAEAFLERESKFKETKSDYDDVAEDAIELLRTNRVSDAVGKLLVEHEMGPELLYYLGQHPEEVKALAGMSDLKAAAAIGRIEAQFAKEESAVKEPAEVKEQPEPPVSKAPKPPTPVSKPSAATKPISLTDPNVDFSAFEREANKKLGKRN